MRFARFMHQGLVKQGWLEGSSVAVATGSMEGGFSATGERIACSEVSLLPPCVPSKAVCVGLNYRDHAEEFNLPIPSSPILFIKPSTSIIGPGAPIIHPKLSKRVDYEAELAIVIGKTAKNLSEEEALSHVFGYTCANDVTARDLQPKDGQWTVAKGFDTFCPIGPVVTDEIDPNNLHIESRLNGKVMQSSNTSNLIFKPAFLVSHISQIMTLFPGDIILTGTPSGIAPMHDGDTIAIEIEGIGLLENSNRS